MRPQRRDSQKAVTCANDRTSTDVQVAHQKAWLVAQLQVETGNLDFEKVSPGGWLCSQLCDCSTSSGAANYEARRMEVYNAAWLPICPPMQGLLGAYLCENRAAHTKHRSAESAQNAARQLHSNWATNVSGLNASGIPSLYDFSATTRIAARALSIAPRTFIAPAASSVLFRASSSNADESLRARARRGSASVANRVRVSSRATLA